MTWLILIFQKPSLPDFLKLNLSLLGNSQEMDDEPHEVDVGQALLVKGEDGVEVLDQVVEDTLLQHCVGEHHQLLSENALKRGT